MKVRVKLMGMLRPHAPPGDELELAEGATIADVLRALEIRPEQVQACTVNERLERDRERPLNDGDTVQLLPPVGGG